VAEAVKAGVEKAGGSATMYQIAETLPEDVLAKMYAAPKPAFPVITPEELAKYDAFIMGVPTRFGNFPAQWKAFWDSTSGLWASGALAGKYAATFTRCVAFTFLLRTHIYSFVGAFSTAGPGGGQESTFIATLSTLTHHGVIYVPLGYAHTFAQITNLSEVHGGAFFL
jgi:NAD(P)H dehydrogenase (quinone)